MGKDHDYIKMALRMDFKDAALIPVKDFIFDHSFRKYCEANDCGFYNRNYACPPYCGTPEEMEGKVKKFENALVLRTFYQVDNAMDCEAMNLLKKEHTNRTLKLIWEIQKKNSGEYLGIMAGPCGWCESCNMPIGMPCVHPDLCFSCLSAYCIDVTKLAARCGIEISWDMKSASFFSIYLF